MNNKGVRRGADGKCAGFGRFLKRPYMENRCLRFHRRGDSRIARDAASTTAKGSV